MRVFACEFLHASIITICLQSDNSMSILFLDIAFTVTAQLHLALYATLLLNLQNCFLKHSETNTYNLQTEYNTATFSVYYINTQLFTTPCPC